MSQSRVGTTRSLPERSTPPVTTRPMRMRIKHLMRGDRETVCSRVQRLGRARDRADAGHGGLAPNAIEDALYEEVRMPFEAYLPVRAKATGLESSASST